MERRRPRRPPQHPLVLVVDGHADTRELYAEALTSFGFEVETVDDVADAYARAWGMHPDVIATEIPLSMDIGWKFFQDLKRDPRTRDIPVVVVTSQVQAWVRARAEQEGCAAFLAKPCLPDDLAIELREALKVQTHEGISAPIAGDMRTCPHCQNTLVFTSRHPVSSVEMALTRWRAEASDGVRCEPAWVCRNGSCDYRELLGET